MKHKSLIILIAALWVLLFIKCTKEGDKENNISDNLVTDIDGNEYHTVIIGDQTWLVENLRTTHYNNGEIIESTIPATKNIVGESEPKYQWIYNGDDDLQDLKYFGRLYTWYAIADPRNVCPTGWHVPGDDEWKELEIYLGMTENEANGKDYRGTNQGSMIAGELNLWPMYSLIVRDTSFEKTGFQAIPAGYRNANGTFEYFGDHGFWWTSNDTDTYHAWFRELYRGDINIKRDRYAKTFGYSIRCVKDSLVDDN